MDEMKVRLERLETMRAAHVHVLSDAPEEDAMKKMLGWAEREGIREARLFGRNTYPTDNSEPHGYEFFLTVGPDVQLEGSVDIREIQGGLYAVVRFQNLNRIGEAWKRLWAWIEESKREQIGMKKGEYGWVDGYEEQLNWQEKKPQTEWIFDLWLQLKEQSALLVEDLRPSMCPDTCASLLVRKHETGPDSGAFAKRSKGKQT